jgi:hypothetical protein
MIICLLVGIVPTIAFAWARGLWMNMQLAGYQVLEDEQARQIWTRYAPDEWPPPDGGTVQRRFGAAYSVVSSMKRPGEASSAPRHGPMMIIEYAAGWPALAFRGGMRDDGGGPPLELVNARPIHLNSLGIKRSTIVPFEPIWGGMLVDVIFYAGLTWLAVRGPWETRRRWREIRGRCGVCGHAWGNDARPTCAQCGADVAGAWGRASSHG